MISIVDSCTPAIWRRSAFGMRVGMVLNAHFEWLVKQEGMCKSETGISISYFPLGLSLFLPWEKVAKEARIKN